MFTKSIIALSALLAIGASTAAFAYEDPENKIGDRYPFLEQRYQPTLSNVGNARNTMAPKLDQYMNEDIENRIGDRYPLLEQPIRFAGVGSKASGRITRQVKAFTLAEKTMFDRESARAVF